jgi:hypothetical protein
MTAAMNRRRFLESGSLALGLGLPFLMAEERKAQAAAVPERLITIYFGNGMPPELTKPGLVGPLASLAKYDKQLTLVRGIKATASSPGITEHSDGSASFCCGMSTADGNRKGGPSLDWVAQTHWKPPTPHKVKAAGVFSAGQSQKIRWHHSWREGGQVNPTTSDPLPLFMELFEGGTGGTAAPSDGKYDRAVVAALRKEYERLSDNRAQLPVSVRERIGRHRNLVKELEDRLALPAAPVASCAKPNKPAAAKTESVREPAAFAAWNQAWPLIAKVFASGMRCDLFRFGSLTLTGGGDEFQMTYDGKTVGDAHGDWFHHYDTSKAAVDYCIGWEMQQITLFLDELSNTKEADGTTMLQNTTVLIGTELGMPTGHKLDNMSFMIVGGKGRFRAGTHEMTGRSDVDLYNTILRATGVPTPFGDMTKFTGYLPITTAPL